jgi:hypothetical protein
MSNLLSTCRAPAVLQMKYCACVTLRPRAMDELTKLASLLLVHNLHRFPNMTHLRLELLVGVLASNIQVTSAAQQRKEDSCTPLTPMMPVELIDSVCHASLLLCWAPPSCCMLHRRVCTTSSVTSASS